MSEPLFVTGLSGFVGSHLQRRLRDSSRWQLLQPPPFDLLDATSLDACFRDGPPAAVIHLAGQTFVPEAIRDPKQTFDINLTGTLNLLQALKRAGFNGKFLYVSSGDIYGQVTEAQLPITEQHLPRPRNPYAVSKLAAELLCLQWSYTEGWCIMAARPFNHIGSGQSPRFVISDMARQLVRVRRGLQPPQLQVGDIDVSRDFLDVDDVISAYLRLLDAGRGGEIYNVCSGVERSIRALIEQLAALAGVTVELQQDTARLRRAEQRRVVGSADKLHRDTGWEAGHSITQTLQSVLSDWEQREAEA